MVTKLIREHIPEWVEAGVVLTGLFVAAIGSASMTLYKVDTMSQDIIEIREAVKGMPVLVEKIESLEEDVDSLELEIRIVEQRSWERHNG